MRRRMILVVAALGVAALVVVPAALAMGGPAEKATGSVWLSHNDDWTRYAEFNAHEENDGRPAKGQFYWYQTDGIRTIQHWIDVDEVAVEGGCAEFSGIASSTVADRNGDRLYVRVCDYGTPGAEGDVFELSWESASYWGYEILSGNLVVHTYD